MILETYFKPFFHVFDLKKPLFHRKNQKIQFIGKILQEKYRGFSYEKTFIWIFQLKI